MMKSGSHLIERILIHIAIVLSISAEVFAVDTVPTIRLLKMSPQDERAIVKMEDGSMKIIKPGDAIGNNGKVIEITSGSVVIEEQTEHGKETVIIRLEKGIQTVERMKKTPDTRPAIYKLQ